MEAIGPLQMRVSWTPPSAPPTVGYRISVNPGRVTVFVSDSTSHTLEVAEPGVYDVIVTSLSSHLPGGTVGPVQVTVGGMIAQNSPVKAPAVHACVLHNS